MNILVIEDNECKFNQISESLNRVLDCPNIVWMKSRNTGLVSIFNRNKNGKLKPYDLVITDNYLPLYDVDENDIFESEEDIKPLAKDIVDEIRRIGLDDLPIVICSSEEVEDCGFNYKIKYDPAVLMDECFKMIFTDVEVYKKMNDTEKRDTELIKRLVK